MTVDQPSVDLRKSSAQWSVQTKVRRGLWGLCWSLFFRPTPKRLGNKWRLSLLRLFGADIQGEALILPSCRILQPWNLTVQDGSAIGESVEIYNYGHVSIGRMTVISQRAYLCTGTHDYTRTDFPLIWKPIVIGAECWIAAEVFVAPGVTIGDGTVIGARSVVTKDMPPRMVCAGNPCRPLKPRVITR